MAEIKSQYSSKAKPLEFLRLSLEIELDIPALDIYYLPTGDVCPYGTSTVGTTVGTEIRNFVTPLSSSLVSPDFTEFMDQYKVYILKSDKDGKYYIGSTSNLERRILDHNKGKVKSTRSGAPWKIVYDELHITLSIAKLRENQIKRWKKRIMIEKLIHGAFV